MNILDLGCGNKKLAGSIGIDQNRLTGVDVVHNLNNFPYPFEDSYFDKIVAINSLEHLDEPLSVLKELNRISKPLAVIKIEVPHFSSCDAFTDQTHQHFFSSRSFDYLDSETDLYRLSYFDKPFFRILSRHVTFWGSNRVIDGFLEFICNRFLLFYERKLAFIFPGHQLIVDLEVVK